MDELTIPAAPHWYKQNILTCAPDNTLLYGAKNDLTIIKEDGETVILTGPLAYITSVGINRKWGEPNKYCVVLYEVGILKVWDIDTLTEKYSVDLHVESRDLIAAVFAGDDRIITVSVTGVITIWNISTNELNVIKHLFPSKSIIICLSVCPHASWLVAFGLQNGLVIVCDLRRKGKILFKLRGHDRSVQSLVWCPAPINIFPKNPNNIVKQYPCQNSSLDDKQEIDKKIKENPWLNLKYSDDDDCAEKTVVADSTFTNTKQQQQEQETDFLQECQDLKAKILDIDTDKKSDTTTTTDNIDSDNKPDTTTTTDNIDSDNKPDTTITTDNIDSDNKPDTTTTIDNNLIGENATKLNEAEIDDQTPIKQKSDRVFDEKIEEKSNRPLPKLYDPSGDFFDEINDSTDDKNSEVTTIQVDDKNSEVTTIQVDDKNSEVTTIDDKNNETTVQEKEIKKQIVDTVPVLPKNIVVTEEEPRVEYLLASTGLDKNIYIWRAGTDGRMQTFFNVPKRKMKAKHPWIMACWPTPNILITTAIDDEILAWDLPKLKKSNVVHNQHQGVVFNIVAPIKYLTKENWSEKIDLQIWSQNGFEIINYNISNNETKLFYSTITAFVTSLVLSPVDPNRLAIGTRDGFIRIWDLSSSNLKSIKLKTIKKVHSKITTIAWHPIKENLLAYGCEDGQLGFVDILTEKSTKFRYSLHNSIYHIEYGPYIDTNSLYLYVVGENRIFIYNTDKPTENPQQLEISEKLLTHRFTWKPDFRLLLISMKDGSVQIYDKQLELLTKLYFNEKGLNSIVWHPNPIRSNWFAAATSKGFFIYDCSDLLKNPNERNLIENKIVDLEGHLRPVTELCWNPFNNDQIVSSSTDGLTHVWDISNKTIIATYIDPYSKQIATPILWSPIDKDLIILGNRLINVWNFTKYPPKSDDEFMTTRKKLLKIETSNNKPKIEVSKPKKIPKNCIVPSLYTSNDDNLEHQVTNMRKLLERTLNQQNNNDIFELFGSRDDVINLLSRNFDLHNKDSKPQYCDLISLWKGDISDRIKSAIEENRVTPSIIMLAPMVSPKLWQDACECYARKLSETPDSDPLEIVKFYLACHKIEDAIDVLCQAFLYREALALAKCRFCENSEIVHKITEKWATHAVANGNFEQAAYCFLSLGNFEEAAKVLARRNNLEFLEFARELAIKCDNKDLSDSIKFKCDEITKNQQQDVEATVLPTRVEVELKNLSISKESDNSSMEFCDAEESKFELE